MDRVHAHRLVLVLLGIACLIFSRAGLSQASSRPVPVTATDPYWILWLSSDAKEREAFLEGFLLGRQTSYLDGCVIARTAVSDLFLPKRLAEEQVSAVDQKCYAVLNAYHLPVAKYARIITELAERYPEDQGVPFDMVLLALSDLSGSEKTAEGIHNSIIRAKIK